MSKDGDLRLKNAPAVSRDDGREDRSLASQSRENEDGASVSIEERRRMLRNEWAQEALPTIPEISGYHLCWLSTTNSYDPIPKRMRLGYAPVLAKELPGFENLKLNSGEFEGCISCNEMVLFKIKAELYQMIMEEFHHNMPKESEQVIKQQVEKLMGADIVQEEVGDGFKDLDQRKPIPVFHP